MTGVATTRTNSGAAVTMAISRSPSPAQSSQTGNYVAFVTLITTYAGTTPPSTTATLLNNPLASGSVAKVLLTRNGQTIESYPGESGLELIVPDADFEATMWSA